MANSTFEIDPGPVGEVTPSRLIPKSCFTTEDTEETTCRFHEGEDGVNAGVWECDPCKVDIESYPVNEMMTVISGALTITNAEGVAENFGPGEVVFVSKGSAMTWHITERLKKYYMTSA